MLHSSKNNLGSAKDGTHHAIAMRLSAVALIPLSLWFVIDFLPMIYGQQEEIIHWFSLFFRIPLTISFFAIGLYHGVLGFQMVIEDYVQSHEMKFVCIAVLRYFSIFSFICFVLVVLHLHFLGISEL